MGYRDIYKESNEQAEERFSLVIEQRLQKKQMCRKHLMIILKRQQPFYYS